MNDFRSVGAMPIFQGALRAKLLLGVDDRLLLVIVVIGLAGILRPVLFLFALGIYLVGRIVGAISPYYFDEVAAYMDWRFFTWSGVAPDDVSFAAKEPKFITKFKKTKI